MIRSKGRRIRTRSVAWVCGCMGAAAVEYSFQSEENASGVCGSAPE